MEREKNLDKIYEAYFKPVSPGTVNVYKERIDWICKQVSGNSVLDIGCSQGITSILLAREAKKVVGIDVEQKSIEFARDALLSENDSTQSHVFFECVNLFEYKPANLFDTVIICEFLEHLADPVAAIKRASTFLMPEGRLICTVPYGINDFIDHKHTYYQYDIVKQLETCFEITDILLLDS